MSHVIKPVESVSRTAGIGRRLLGFGAAGFAAALVAAPMAHAGPPTAPSDTTADTGTPPDPATPTATDPVAPTPTDSATPIPTDPAAPTGPATPTDSPTAPTDSPAPPATGSTSTGAPANPVPATGARARVPVLKSVKAAPNGRPSPDYGAQKIQVGIQLKSDGTYYPSGASLENAHIVGVETDINGVVVRGGSCTPTQSTPTTATCPPWLASPGDTVTFTQDAAPDGPGVLLDPVPNVVGPCEQSAGPGLTPAIPDPTPTLPACGIGGEFGPVVVTPHVVTRDGFGANVVFNEPGVPPVAEPDAATVTTGHSVDVQVLANDTADGDPDTTITVDTAPKHGSAAVHGNVIRYTPAAGFGGVDSFSYTLTTSNGASTATAVIRVKAPPVAADDSARTLGGSGAPGHPVTVPALANDSANGGGAITLASVADPAHGAASISGTGVIYTPDADFAGTEAFSYSISTADGTDVATIRVTVTAPVVVAAVSADQLASTGAASGQLLGVGSLLLLVGGGATAAGRRRRLHA